MKTNVMIKKMIVLMAVIMFLPCAGAVAQEGVVSLNKASVAELIAIEDLELDEDLAKAIVAYREKNGAFKKPEDLANVPGMDEDWMDEINPMELDGDIVYNPEEEASMKAY